MSSLTRSADLLICFIFRTNEDVDALRMEMAAGRPAFRPGPADSSRTAVPETCL